MIRFITTILPILLNPDDEAGGRTPLEQESIIAALKNTIIAVGNLLLVWLGDVEPSALEQRFEVSLSLGGHGAKLGRTTADGYQLRVVAERRPASMLLAGLAGRAIRQARFGKL
jgi:hypothetical protein